MTTRAPRVLDTALLTAVGLTAETSAASVRAGISRIQEHSWVVDAMGEPLMHAPVPTLDPELVGPERIYLLTAQILKNIGRRMSWSGGISLSIALAVPEHRPGWSEDTERELLRRLPGEYGPLRIDVGRIVARGHAGGLVAVDETAKAVASGQVEIGLVVGVESYLDMATIGKLAADGRLAQHGARSTFTIGEAAAAVLVASPSVCRRAGEELAIILGASTSDEPNPLESDRECLAEGLIAALDGAISPLDTPDDAIAQTYIDINGERYREEEWGMAMLRCSRYFEDPLRYVSAVRAWGDVGAASGLAFICLATQAWKRGYSQGPRAALVAGSDSGQRAVMVLQQPTPPKPAQEPTPSPSEEADVVVSWVIPNFGDHGPEPTELLDPIISEGDAESAHEGGEPGATVMVDALAVHAANMPPDLMPANPDPTQTVRLGGQRRRGRRPGKITLRVIGGPQASKKEETLTGSRIRVGRSDTADFTVDHPSLSGLHFELRIRRDGIDLFDLGSKNGTMLFERRVYHARVQLGDVIVAGDCEIKLVDAADIDVDQGAEAREDGLLGISDAIQEAFAAIDAAASCDLPTLVCGKTGTGKDLAAQAIHRRSRRSAAPFVVLDCSTLPSGLAESAILGHCKGAFTGADSDRRGAFEEASGGTLMLDEIGELPLDLQVKLLRVLDRGEVVRVGENKPRSVDARIIAATHGDLLRMVDDGQFREDLYYRLSGLVIEMPSLQDRGGDEIEYLANAFLVERAVELPTKLNLSPSAIEALRNHHWRGNVRELAAVIARAVVLRSSDTIAPKDLALRVNPTRATRLGEYARFASYSDAHAGLDRWLLPRILADCGGDIEEAARRLGRSAPELIKRMQSLGLYTARS